MITVALIGANRDAWGYLLDSVASEHTIDRADRKAAYYMANGTPPGRWAGHGAAALELPDGDVQEDHLVRLFGDGIHPITEKQLGRRYHVPEPLEHRIERRIREAAAAPENRHLDHDEFIALVDQIREDETNTPQKVKQSVAGFEFVFSPPKSVSSWWALADPELKDQIRRAHHAAIDATIEKLETDIVRTRTGTDGVAQTHVRGITAALFDHWDSRDGDPQLHTHMLVSNRVQGMDGRWRTIDSRWALMPAIATASAYYDGVLMDELSSRFGLDWTTEEVLRDPEGYRDWLHAEQRPDTVSARHQFSLSDDIGPGSVKWQIAGVPDALSSEFSTRSKAIRREKDRLIREYVALTGKQPSKRTIIKMRQQATYCTRQAKKHRSLRDLTQWWRHRAGEYVGNSFLFADRVLGQGRERLSEYPLWSFRDDDVRAADVGRVAQGVLFDLGAARSTWGRRNAETAALRQIAGWRFRSPHDRDQAVQRVVDEVLAHAVPLTPKNELHTPRRFMNPDGVSQFASPLRDLYTTRQVWDAEERLLTAGRDTGSVRVDHALIEELLTRPLGPKEILLSSDKTIAVENILSSGRAVDVLVGPAGAGKTTSLKKFREIWEAAYGPGSVRGLAPSAVAAEVLGESLGISTENTAMWLTQTSQAAIAGRAEHIEQLEAALRDAQARNRHRAVGKLTTALADARSRDAEWTLQPGHVVIVDEASLAGTTALDEIRAQCQEAGAKMLLVGDWAQLSAVDAGGAFGLLATDRHDVAELFELHRFSDEWEADASRLLRIGNTHALDAYIAHDRVSHGLDESIVMEAAEAWKRDEMTVAESGKRPLVSLLIAPTNEVVDRLNDIARDWRIEKGWVDPDRTVPVAGDTVVSPGDRIVTRENERRLRTDHDRWVKNGDTWQVIDVTDTGDIIAGAGEERVMLPAEYARAHVQLGYATTAHRAQGRTVDTAHTIVDSTATRETFYVAMTRGQMSNRAYVVVDEAGQMGDNAATGMSRTWRETLEHVVRTRGGDISAHQTLADEAARIGSIRQLAAEYQTLVSDQLEQEYLPMLAQLGLVDEESPDSPYLGPVLANLRRLERHQVDVPGTVTELLESRGLGDARDVLAVLHYRLATRLEDLRELPAYERFLPMVAEFRIEVDPADPQSALRFYRTLAAVEGRTGNVEEALRETLLRIDRQASRALPAQVAAILRREHGVEDEEIAAPEQLRMLDPDLIAGLIERAPGFSDQDVMRALEDRELAIGLRAEMLVDQAIAERAEWLDALGEPLPGGEEAWRRRAVAVACYRDLYDVDDPEPLGSVQQTVRNQERDRQNVAAMFASGYAQQFSVEPEHQTSTAPDIQEPTTGITY